jgi:hypothetical protein
VESFFQFEADWRRLVMALPGWVGRSLRMNDTLFTAGMRLSFVFLCALSRADWGFHGDGCFRTGVIKAG